MVKVCSRENEISIVGIARNGLELLKLLPHTYPDVIVLDLKMPYKDGVTVLGDIMRTNPTPILICAPEDSTNTSLAIECMSKGAIDAMLFPEYIDPMKLEQHLDLLPSKIRMVAKVKPIRILNARPKMFESGLYQNTSGLKTINQRMSKVLAIGASTGGPSAIRFILSKLPSNLRAAILIAQHIPSNFTAEFSKMLSKHTDLVVKEAFDGEILEGGKVYVAPGGRNMVIGDSSNIEIHKPCHSSVIPSVDEMMSSVATSFGKQAIGVVLTGMGDDGKLGIRRIKQMGGMSIAQDKDSSVVFGMPKEAESTGCVDYMLPLETIPKKIMNLLGEENVA
jgi:two-component system chemotaxis response regulator CheB